MEIFLFFKLFLILDLIFRFGFVIITNGLWRDVRAGRRSMIGNHVYGNRRTRGSNPLLSATISCRFVGRIFLCSEYLRRSAVKLTGRVCPRSAHGADARTDTWVRPYNCSETYDHNNCFCRARKGRITWCCLPEKAPSVLANCGVLRMEHFHLLSRGKQSTGLLR